MERQQIISLFIQKGILSKNGSRKKQCWQKFYDDESKLIFTEYSKNFRIDEEAWFCLLHNVDPYTCEICGSLAKFTGRLKSKIPGYLTVCDKCSANSSPNKLQSYSATISKRTEEEKQQIVKKRKQTNYSKYGDENYTLYGSIKFKTDLFNKYGSSTYNNKEKIKQTCLERYNVSCNLSINSAERSKKIWDTKYHQIIEKRKHTVNSKYGVDHVGQNKLVQQKIVNKKQMHVNAIESTYNCTQQKKLIDMYGQGWKILDLEKIIIDGRTFISNENIPLIEQYVNEGHHTNKYVSNKEKELLSYIRSIYDGEVLENVTNVIAASHNRWYELDIYLPELHIGFDFDGTYWHSTEYKDKYYHQRKTIACYTNGIQLIHIYEYDWDNNKSQIQQNIVKLLNHQDCAEYNWISVQDFHKYSLSAPNMKIFDNHMLYDEGTFEKI